MEGHRYVLLHLKLVREGLAKMGRKPGISIADDLGGKAEPLIHVIQVQLGYSWAGYRCVTEKEDHRSGTTLIHDGQDSILSLVSGEARDQVHHHSLEWEGVFFGRDTV